MLWPHLEINWPFTGLSKLEQVFGHSHASMLVFTQQLGPLFPDCLRFYGLCCLSSGISLGQLSPLGQLNFSLFQLIYKPILGDRNTIVLSVAETQTQRGCRDPLWHRHSHHGLCYPPASWVSGRPWCFIPLLNSSFQFFSHPKFCTVPTGTLINWNNSFLSSIFSQNISFPVT